MKSHSVEKIGGTSMSDYVAIRDNIISKPSREDTIYQRVFVVSAYGGMTDALLEHKKTSQPGIYALFANGLKDKSWHQALQQVKADMQAINAGLFGEGELLQQANSFIGERLDDAEQCLVDLQRLCQHGHFELSAHLATVREMLASIGEAHSAWNTAKLLERDGFNACFVDLTGWRAAQHTSLDERIVEAFQGLDLASQIPIATGYAHSEEGLMSTFDRGYSEMTFSRIAVLTEARETIIHKEFHLSTADPRLVGEENAIPIGRTNYDVADQLANLGMEAIHPKAAKGLRSNRIPLRVKNTFEPDHPGTLITGDYVSDEPCVEIIAGCKGIYALEVFDQGMTGSVDTYDQKILELIRRFKGHVVSKDINANTITHYLATNLKTVKRIYGALEKCFPEAEIDQCKVAIVSAIGSNMQVPGMLAVTVKALAQQEISVLAMHQSMRQVDMQFVVNEDDYDLAVKSLHSSLVEIHNHGIAICPAN
ncbi:aspartate kinase [Oleiphilus sp. HI0068]|jgi:aspartate kinase|uniref:aspartate kinase n=3 Tax=Oleiphilus TaxID=141450 RepID=UPI0007C243F3|nr:MULTISPECIES: aspartate kinase [unclassified Oleiphilus]KZY77679.1 aspartate kinase [Oleiphilus sp. HI0069]KZY84059.1 aspartate kinase [Oleiphilus sp. HI0068]KZZ34595.1 aspartate kinase [Oleiphilus sp. HI0085]KZY30670.1 aspartate kinase [Oleiphilus sp. HI0043]KZY66297.1 aspartate kinase [Oleiphilus sp. HI0061]